MCVSGLHYLLQRLIAELSTLGNIAPQMYDDGYKNIVNIDVRTKSFDRADSSFAR